MEMIILRALVLVCFAMCARSQFYMYSPGESIEPYVDSNEDVFGTGEFCRSYISGNTVCQYRPYVEVSTCTRIPSNVTETPVIEYTNFYTNSTTSETRITVRCGSTDVNKAPGDWKLYLTFNGTLPDIYGECVKDSRGEVCVSTAFAQFPPGTGEFWVVARCQYKALIPSRILYIRRNQNFDAIAQCLPSRSDPRYHELKLPRCDPALYGLRCDGQTLIPEALIPQPSSYASPVPSPSIVPQAPPSSNGNSTPSVGSRENDASSEPGSLLFWTGMPLLFVLAFYP